MKETTYTDKYGDDIAINSNQRGIHIKSLGFQALDGETTENIIAALQGFSADHGWSTARQTPDAIMRRLDQLIAEYEKEINERYQTGKHNQHLHDAVVPLKDLRAFLTAPFVGKDGQR